MVITVKPCHRVDTGGSRLLDLMGETGRKRAEGENAVKKKNYILARSIRLDTHTPSVAIEGASPMPSKVTLLPRFRWASKAYLPFASRIRERLRALHTSRFISVNQISRCYEIAERNDILT